MPTSLKIYGLDTANNTFGAPVGSLARALNLVFEAPNLLRSRRGFAAMTYTFGSGSDRANSIHYHLDSNHLLVHHGTSSLSYDTGSNFTSVSGTYARVASAYPPRFETAGVWTFFTAASGVKGYTNGTAHAAGAPRPLIVYQLAVSAGVTTWLANNSSVAYRATIQRTQTAQGFFANNVTLVESAPCGRSTITNTAGGARGVTMRVRLPSDALADDKVRLWRSVSVGSGVTPSDEMYLCNETTLDNTDVSVGYVDVNDATPDAFLGEPLYASPNVGQGPLSANFRPPVCLDLAFFDGKLWFLNVQANVHRFFTDLLGVSAPDGLVANDTVTVGGQTYTAKASANHPAREFALTTGGTASENVQATALDLILCINSDASATCYAFYESGDEDAPGRMSFEGRTLGQSAFTFATSRTSAFSVIGGTSVNDANQARCFYSKDGEYEHVPLLNYLDAGAASAALHKGIALRGYGLVLFKSDGIWLISAPAPYTVEKISDAKILGINTPVLLADKVWAFTDQGWVSVGPSGVSVVDLPIEGETIATINGIDFAFGYETERLLIAAHRSATTDTYAPVQHVYSTRAGQWTEWDLDVRCAALHALTDKVYLGDASSNTLLKERKTLDRTDFADASFSVTISSSSGAAVTLASASNVQAGDRLVQGSLEAIVESVSGNVVTVTHTLAWAAGAATSYRAIACALTFNPWTGGDPAVPKTFPQMHWLFKDTAFEAATTELTTDFQPVVQEAEVHGSGWGIDAWGGYWGSPSSVTKLHRICPLPATVRQANHLHLGLVITEAWSDWSLQGFNVDAKPVSEEGRAKR
jgi:hypothetical protein